ncbi:MAG: signal peptidase I [Planctomycetaceae bacterium]|nr:signal peptidase I [Planctomycetaceae bacterium]
MPGVGIGGRIVAESRFQSLNSEYFGSVPDVEMTSTKPRRAWLAALLSLLGGPLGQVYTGHFGRGVLLWLIGTFLLPILWFLTVFLPLGRVGLMLLLLCALAFPIYLAVDAFLLARRNSGGPLKRYQRWWVYVLLFLVCVVANRAVTYAVRSFVAEPVVQPVRAMSPAIQAGDCVLIEKCYSSAERLRHHDIVAFRSDGLDSPLYVMRVAGLPGETIEIRNERVLINGVQWHDKCAVFEGPLSPHVDLANYGPLKIPSDCFFVLGDNRRVSKDSRLLGPIPFVDFYGKVRMIYWSQARVFPDPGDTSHYLPGPIRWDRMGTRLD